MERVAVRELKAKLSEYLAKVKSGQEVVVTERGKPVAKLVPLPSDETMDERLADLERQGLIRRGTGKLPDDFWDLPRPSDPEGRALKTLLEERESGW